MTVARKVAGLGLWLLRPSRRLFILKCMGLGVLVKAATVPLLLACLLGNMLAGGPPLPAPASPAELVTRQGVVTAALVAPLLETFLMAVVFALTEPPLYFNRTAIGALVTVGAVLLHRDDLPTVVTIGFTFAVLSAQYVVVRTRAGTAAAIAAAAVTHSTFNMVAAAAALAAFRAANG